ncbi:hypothetical protein [Sneathiella sp.]|uniref:hypothetical protein n=1 Tax=Sneathiella sp. TaxID=1964365 RepID=UPI002618E864|nr:hypothetical protein [Sneathiella sp.]MDF2367575.1 hypothetical protein [Sneathiella sp.]
MSTSENTTNACRSLAELKIRSRILLKAAAQEKPAALHTLRKFGKQEPPFQHKDGLKAVSRLAGFKNWQHASHVLGGAANIGDDMGVIWYDTKCTGLLNIWCRNYAEAQEQFDQRENGFLFPYKTQFVVTNGEYVRALGFETDHPLLQVPNRNFVEIYGTPAWDDLTFQRLQQAMGATTGN